MKYREACKYLEVCRTPLTCAANNNAAPTTETQRPFKGAESVLDGTV